MAVWEGEIYRNRSIGAICNVCDTGSWGMYTQEWRPSHRSAGRTMDRGCGEDRPAGGAEQRGIEASY
jgi:hypothetical protein